MRYRQTLVVGTMEDLNMFDVATATHVHALRSEGAMREDATLICGGPLPLRCLLESCCVNDYVSGLITEKRLLSVLGGGPVPRWRRRGTGPTPS